jgi:CelD/BcsL family acetyltransferase involved in cellulose biosynthesis
MAEFQASLITKHDALASLAKNARAEGLLPRRLEHELTWIAENNHGAGSWGGAMGIFSGERLVAYVPFRFRKTRLRLRLGEMSIASVPYNFLQLYGEGMVGGNHSAADIAATLLERIEVPFHALTLEEAPVDSPLWHALAHVRRPFRSFVRSRAQHRLIALPNRFDKFEQQLSKQTRYNLRRNEKRLTSLVEDHRSRSFTSPKEVAELASLIEQVVTKTYHYTLLGQDLTTRNSEFWENVEFWARQGWLRAYILYGNDKPIAYSLGYVINRVYQYEYPGYDPAFSAGSPGLLLLRQMIRDLIENDVADVLDFGAGDARYKQELGNRDYEEGAMIVVSPNVYARSAVGAERLLSAVSRIASRSLDGLGIKAKLKRFLRDKS